MNERERERAQERERERTLEKREKRGAGHFVGRDLRANDEIDFF